MPHLDGLIRKVDLLIDVGQSRRTVLQDPIEQGSSQHSDAVSI